MARIRSIHPGVASDEAFMSMSMAAKAAWPILWTECDDHGVFEWKPIVLKARIFPADNVDFSAILTEYEGLDCIQKFEVDGKSYGCIKNFGKYQRPKHPSYRFPFPECIHLFVRISSSPPPAGGEDTYTTPENPPQMKEEGGSSRREEGEERKETSARDSDFSEWYAIYPKHEGRGQAVKAFRAALKKVDLPVLLDGARRARDKYSGTEPRFIPLPASWLNGERWADEAAANGAATPRNDIFPDEIYRGLS